MTGTRKTLCGSPDGTGWPAQLLHGAYLSPTARLSKEFGSQCRTLCSKFVRRFGSQKAIVAHAELRLLSG
jgi:hypothetical protein